MSTYSIIRGIPIQNIEEKTLPSYPKRRETLLGLEAFQGEAARKTISAAVLNPCFPIKYTCMLARKESGMLVHAKVITHLELSDWCEMKGYDLLVMDAPPDMAMPNERTELG
jgi:hypothetical protein